MHRGQDLEVITQLLALAAIELTISPAATFTEAQLLHAARAYAEPEIRLEELDFGIVLAFSCSATGLLQKHAGGRYSLR